MDKIIPTPKTEAGNYKTRTLFKELQVYTDTELPIFSLEMFKNSLADDSLLSFPKLYVDFCTDDPTEIALVDKVFNGDRSHWEAIKSLKNFKEPYEAMVKEARQRAVSKQIAKLDALSYSNKEAIALGATKVLLELNKNLDSVDKKSKKKVIKDNDELLANAEEFKKINEALERVN